MNQGSQKVFFGKLLWDVLAACCFSHFTLPFLFYFIFYIFFFCFFIFMPATHTTFDIFHLYSHSLVCFFTSFFLAVAVIVF